MNNEDEESVNKEEEEEDEEFDPIDLGNGWLKIQTSQWLNQITGESIEFQPQYPAGKQEGESLDIINNSIAVQENGAQSHPQAQSHPHFAALSHPHFEAQSHPHLAAQSHPHFAAQSHPHFAAQSHPHLAAQSHPHLAAQSHPHLAAQSHPHLMPQTAAPPNAQQMTLEQQQRLLFEQQQLENQRKLNNCSTTVAQYAGHLKGANRADLLRACVNEYANHYNEYYPQLVNQMLVGCQMIDPNYIPTFVGGMPAVINSKGDAGQPVDLMDSDDDDDDDNDNDDDDGDVDGNVDDDAIDTNRDGQNNLGQDGDEYPEHSEHSEHREYPEHPAESTGNGMHSNNYDDSSEDDNSSGMIPPQAQYDASVGDQIQSSQAGSQGEPLVLSDDANEESEPEENIEDSSSAGLAV